jgi:hypothetical protein
VLGRLLAFNRAGFVSDQEGFGEEEYAEEPVIKEGAPPTAFIIARRPRCRCSMAIS